MEAVAVENNVDVVNTNDAMQQNLVEYLEKIVSYNAFNNETNEIENIKYPTNNLNDFIFNLFNALLSLDVVVKIKDFHLDEKSNEETTNTNIKNLLDYINSKEFNHLEHNYLINSSYFLLDDGTKHNYVWSSDLHKFYFMNEKNEKDETEAENELIFTISFNFDETGNVSLTLTNANEDELEELKSSKIVYIDQ